MASLDDPLVPNGCENFGAIKADLNVCQVDYLFGNFTKMLVGQRDQALASPMPLEPTPGELATLLAEINERLGLADSDPLKLVLLDPISGSMPAFTPQTIVIDGQTRPIPTVRNIPITISQMISQKNYELARSMNTGRPGSYWLLNPQFMWGGNNGLSDYGAVLQLSNVVPDGASGLHTATGNLSYTGLWDPKRTPSPL